MAGILRLTGPAGQVGVQLLTTSGRIDRLTTNQVTDFVCICFGIRLAYVTPP
jgi:hypothetical protein